MKKILTADIGGTNSRFAYFELNEKQELVLINVKWLKTSESASFSDLMKNLHASGFPLTPEESDIIVIAIAGPVENNIKSSPPFISWDIDISGINEQNWYNRTILINDFIAQAYACLSTIGKNATHIKSGKSLKNTPIAIIGAGTALGKAVLFPDDNGVYHAAPSEGGHASFPFESGDEQKFQDFLISKSENSCITWNNVVSGRGLTYIHLFLTGQKIPPEDISLDTINDTETLAWAARFYGRACRCFSLEVLSQGGLFITGGIAARMPEIITHQAFNDEFVRSDTFSSLLKDIPIFLIKDQNAGLWGSAVLGMKKLGTSYTI